MFRDQQVTKALSLEGVLTTHHFRFNVFRFVMESTQKEWKNKLQIKTAHISGHFPARNSHLHQTWVNIHYSFKEGTLEEPIQKLNDIHLMYVMFNCLASFKAAVESFKIEQTDRQTDRLLYVWSAYTASSQHQHAKWAHLSLSSYYYHDDKHNAGCRSTTHLLLQRKAWWA